MQQYTEFKDQRTQEIRQDIPDIADLLKEMVGLGASDLHIISSTFTSIF